MLRVLAVVSLAVLLLIAALLARWLITAAARGLRRLRTPAALPPEPPADRAVTAAWDAVGAVARRFAPRLNHARDPCARLLAAAGPDATDFPLLEWAVFIRRRVPELAEIGLADWRTAPPAERPARLEALVVSLERIGEEAQRRLAAAAPDAQQIATLHAHIEARTRHLG